VPRGSFRCVYVRVRFGCRPLPLPTTPTTHALRYVCGACRPLRFAHRGTLPGTSLSLSVVAVLRCVWIRSFALRVARVLPPRSDVNLLRWVRCCHCRLHPAAACCARWIDVYACALPLHLPHVLPRFWNFAHCALVAVTPPRFHAPHRVILRTCRRCTLPQTVPRVVPRTCGITWSLHVRSFTAPRTRDAVVAHCRCRTRTCCRSFAARRVYARFARYAVTRTAYTATHYWSIVCRFTRLRLRALRRARIPSSRLGAFYRAFCGTRYRLDVPPVCCVLMVALSDLLFTRLRLLLRIVARAVALHAFAFVSI